MLRGSHAVRAAAQHPRRWGAVQKSNRPLRQRRAPSPSRSPRRYPRPHSPWAGQAGSRRGR
ncbi:hypothetical protein F2B00_20795 [Streptomyces parvus]|nr:hypothetical protein F2B00_20795 [Streptomyces parvus]